MKIPLLVLVYLACWPDSVSAQTLVRTVPGTTAGQFYGTAVIRAGDQNGDGFEDLLVGAPGHSGDRGGIFCVSGSFLASGSGAIHLWSLNGSIAGGRFGTALIMAGNLTGNSAPDIVVGSPGPNGTAPGLVHLVDGSSHALVSTKPLGTIATSPQNAGHAFANLGDLDGDGKAEIAVGIPFGASTGSVLVATGASLTNNAALTAGVYSGSIFIFPRGYGMSLAAADLNGDGDRDLVVGSPFEASAEAGLIELRDLRGPTTFFRTYSPGVNSEQFGTSVDVADDYDGDGKPDVIVGAPNHGFPNQTVGQAYVLSGAKLAANVQPELLVLPGGATTLGGFFSLGWRFGAAVRASSDLNNDGVGDIVIGMPTFITGLGGTPKGAARVFSGKTGALMAHVTGAANETIGDAVLGALDDLDGDGFAEWVVAGPNGDIPLTDCGSIKCYRLWPASASPYCTGKVNSLGCTPFMFSTGLASKSSPSPFSVNCSNVINKKTGVLLYSHTPGASPFQGGFLCVKAPIKRVGAQSSGGSTTGNDCTGTFTFDFKTQIQGGADPTLVVGSEVFCQYWSRDPQSPSGTSLSNALRFVINP